MPAYIVVEVDIHDPERYGRYKDMAPPSIYQYGGKYIARGGACETLEGDWKPPRFVILEFPDTERARARSGSGLCNRRGRLSARRGCSGTSALGRAIRFSAEIQGNNTRKRTQVRHCQARALSA